MRTIFTDANVPEGWTRDEKVSKDWWLSFKSRDNDLTLKVAENISSSRAELFNKDRIECFYEQAKSVLDKLNIDFYLQLISAQ